MASAAVTTPAEVARVLPIAPPAVRAYLAELEAALAQLDPSVNRLGASHRRDPETSHAAAHANFPHSGSQRYRVLLALAEVGKAGATFKELIAVTDIKSAARRLSELKAGGWAAATGRRRHTSVDVTAEVYVATPAARTHLRLVGALKDDPIPAWYRDEFHTDEEAA